MNIIDYSLQYREPAKFRAEKGRVVSEALAKIQLNGFAPKLNNWDNAHITARSRSGKTMSYYACTGTITGYAGTDIEGLDAFIGLLKRL